MFGVNQTQKFINAMSYHEKPTSKCGRRLYVCMSQFLNFQELRDRKVYVGKSIIKNMFRNQEENNVIKVRRLIS